MCPSGSVEQCFKVARCRRCWEQLERQQAHDEISSTTILTLLPEELVGKLSVLNMLQDKQYVDGVGLNCGEGMFYVCR